MSADVTSPAADAGSAAPPGIPQKPAVPSWRLVATLAIAGAIAATALSVVYEVTRPTILANKARVLREAVGEVLKGPARIVSLAVTPDGLAEEKDVVYEVSSDRVDRVFLGYDDEDRPIGYAIVGAAYGYGSDPIRLIFGYDPTTREILGMKVLEHKETPGIGTKIETLDAFTAQFWRPVEAGTRRSVPRQAPVVGARMDQAPKDDPTNVDMISGATISSRAVVKAVNEAVGQVGEKLASHAARSGG